MTEREKLIKLVATGFNIASDKIHTEIRNHVARKHSYNSKKDSTTPIQVLLADYLIDNGVVVLPCKVGDTVYFAFPKKGIVAKTVKRIQMVKKGVYIVCSGSAINIDEIGKTVFLTREQAEQALMESDANV